ncbi:LysM peptidoglycan-binding domain-containing protein [Kineococcus terrestris]|uniref:LysM peptidoglycan-binding domain-containing protein n=1 Tax=Kineococcus terrestris TaxID=2044856 RepID=UPI0034DADF2B
MPTAPSRPARSSRALAGQRPSAVRLVAAAATGAVLTALPPAGATALLLVARPALAAAAGPARSGEDLLLAAAALAGSLVLALLTASVAGAAVGELRALRHGRRRTSREAARPVARVVALLVGLAVGSGSAAASAAPRTPDAGWAVAATAPALAGAGQPGGTVLNATVPEVLTAARAGVPDAGWAPARAVPVDLPGALRAPAPAGQGAGQGAEHVVQRGDTLWSLAADRLGPDAEAADVLAEAHRLHVLNTDVVGADPDRLLPGQVLRLG